LKRILTEEHHRRPRSLGGSNDAYNISYVVGKSHRKWHFLFGNLNPTQICEKINNFYWKPEGVRLVCSFINGNEVTKRGGTDSKYDEKCQDAWNSMFKKLPFQKAINYINSVWLDPSYHFYVRRK